MLGQGAPPGCDPRLARLFAPPHPRLGTYEVCAAGVLPGAAFSGGGFTTADPEHLEVLDAFGSAGTFDRATLVQLYGGRRVDVRRGWRIVGGRFESITEISPYPDLSLAALNEGTLLIRWTLDLPASAGRGATASPR